MVTTGKPRIKPIGIIAILKMKSIKASIPSSLFFFSSSILDGGAILFLNLFKTLAGVMDSIDSIE